VKTTQLKQCVNQSCSSSHSSHTPQAASVVDDVDVMNKCVTVTMTAVSGHSEI